MYFCTIYKRCHLSSSELNSIESTESTLNPGFESHQCWYKYVDELSQNTVLVTSTQVHYLSHHTVQYGAHSVSSVIGEFTE